ncbi:hypothetical protein ACFVJ8_35210 [Streptomyces yangpuensis]|uniref:hypothetical protein n=1 Tax=Streptomyces yangpuensis TaxID=1648182 RepID=UPI003630AB2A
MYGPEQEPEAAATSATTAIAAATRDGSFDGVDGLPAQATVAAHAAIIVTAHQRTQGPDPAATSTIRSASARTHEATARQMAVVFRGVRSASTATTTGRTARAMQSSTVHSSP